MAENTNLVGQFQSVLGRAPSEEELAYFNRFITEGSIQPHEVGQILQGTPEFQKAQLEANTTAYGNRLQASDDQALARGAEVAGAQAQSRFAGLGRPNSSALAASVFGQTGQMAQDLAQQRQSALAQFYGQGLQQNQNIYGQQGQTPLSRAYGLRDETRQRNYQIEDYYRQQNDYQNEKNASSGWKAITPEFVASGLFSMGGQALGGYLGGKAGAAKKAV